MCSISADMGILVITFRGINGFKLIPSHFKKKILVLIGNPGKDSTYEGNNRE